MNKLDPYSGNKDSRLWEYSEDKLFLFDIIRFVNSAWKLIAIGGLAGLTIAICFLILAPKKYEANAQVAMAQIWIDNNNNININNNINNNNSLGVNIEDPELLISRLSSPASLTPNVTAACGFDGRENVGLFDGGSIRLTVPKKLANVVELKTFGPTPQAARGCALALFELIQSTQSQLVTPLIEEAKGRASDYEARLQSARDLVAKTDGSDRPKDLFYLHTRDEIRYLQGEIAALKKVVVWSQNRATRLVAPVYAGNMPIAPKKIPTLIIGLFGGCVAGLLIVFARGIMADIKRQANGV